MTGFASNPSLPQLAFVKGSALCFRVANDGMTGFALGRKIFTNYATANCGCSLRTGAMPIVSFAAIFARCSSSKWP